MLPVYSNSENAIDGLNNMYSAKCAFMRSGGLASFFGAAEFYRFSASGAVFRGCSFVTGDCVTGDRVAAPKTGLS